MQALDLTFDRLTDQRVRAEWERLRDAGLPSLARHTGVTNRPHVTLDSRDHLAPESERRLGAVAGRLPLEVRIGPVLLFHARRRWVLARHVVVGRSLLELHEDAVSILGAGGSPLTEPGRWVPHVTLARGLSGDQLAQALTLVAASSEFTGTALRLRRWDQQAGRSWDVPPQASAGRSL